jgi:D-alanyl-D-alanine carboxypeptidase/D-alanyl-D-alanine-endopeptidase (penicillin-binding protein 4)
VAAALVAVLVFVSACAARRGAVPPPSSRQPAAATDPHEQLRSELRAIFSAPTVDHGVWAVAVHSLKSGETFYSSNAHRLQVPASNQKVLTTAVAAERLGWDYRYTTQLYANAPIVDGRIEGDLIVVANGDPTINPRHEQRWAAFDGWARQLAAAGVRAINGHLIGDDNAFAEPGWGLGWSWDDFAPGYGAPVSALQYYENQVELLVGPGLAADRRGIISVSPPGSDLTIDNQVVTVPAGGDSRISLERIPGSTVLTVRGQVAIGSPALRDTAAVPNPTTFYLNALREALSRHGIAVGGSTIDIDDVQSPLDRSKATLLLEDRSASLFDIVDTTNKWSRNIYAETLLRSLSPAGAPATTEAGLKALAETLGRWGVSGDYFLARDGSGLSRYDYLSPNALIGSLTYMWRNPDLADKFRASLPVSGVSGSLANRMKGTPAEGKVQAKTGSMSQVRSLAGYVETADGEPLVFAFIVNGFRVPMREMDAAMDQALIRLVAFKHPRHRP